MLLDLPHVSMRLWPRAMDIDDAAHAVAGILAIHQWPTSCIVAHSFGTFVASRLCQLHPACVQATVRTLPTPPPPPPPPQPSLPSITPLLQTTTLSLHSGRIQSWRFWQFASYPPWAHLMRHGPLLLPFASSRLCQLHPACVQATVRTPLLPPSSTPSPHCILGACNFARYGMLAIHHWPTSCAMAHSFGLSCPPACASFILPASRQQCAAYPSCTHNPGADISLLLHSWGPIHRLHFPTLLLGDRLH